MEKKHHLLTVTEVARLLDCSSDSVRRYERIGILPAIRVGNGHRLFAHVDVERLRVRREKKLNQIVAAAG